MRYSIATEETLVSQHFGRCPSFTIFDLDDGQVANLEVAANPGHMPGAIPQFLKEKGVECIIAGGMGMRAQNLFQEFGIQTVMGVGGSVEEVIETLKSGELKGGESSCKPGAGKGYGLDKQECDHPHDKDCE